MLSELAFNDDFIDLPPPAKEQLRKHARFLRNHCGVPLGHAQEMVAWFFHFKNWGDLAARQIQKTDEAARLNWQKYKSHYSCTEIIFLILN